MNRDNELVHEAWINLKTGDKALARRYAERALLMVDDFETKVKAHFILSQTTDDLKEKRDHLETVLSYDPAHAEARRALAILDGKLKPGDIVNADRLPAQSSDPEAAKADRFACPQCGARRVFAPDGISLVCEHCGYNDALANGSAADEKDFFVAMATARGHRKPVATQVFHCNGCGAEFTLPPGVISSTCAYCDSPHVVRLDKSRELLEPDGIIPHALTLKQAIEKLVFWVNQSTLRPERKVDQPRPVYLPIWTFDLGGGINISGERVEPDTSPQVGWKQAQSRMRVVQVREQYSVLVNDLIVPASKQNTAILNRLLPTFDLSAIQPYDARYLANWPAEIYDISMSDASLEARAQAVRQYTDRLQREAAYIQNMRLSSAGMTVESFKLVLLPVWMTEVQVQGKLIHVLINGQNGRIV
jgi:DNA-directed RNA polymerase subunit RPC12/RpoP